jgi:hypothetical protein
MKTAIIAGAVAVTALVAGLFVWGRTPVPAAVEDPPMIAPSGSNADERIAALERSVVLLQRRIAELEGRPAAAAPPVPVAGGTPSAVDPEIKAAVRAANEELRAEERAEREQRREERMLQRDEQREQAWRDFVAKAQLDIATAERIKTMLDQEQATVQESVRLAMEQGRDRREVRRSARELREKTDAEVAKLLSEPQKQAYQELRREAGPGMRFGGGD